MLAFLRRLAQVRQRESLAQATSYLCRVAATAMFTPRYDVIKMAMAIVG